MIYGIIDEDPEWGEKCVTNLSNSLGELLHKISNFYYCKEGLKTISDYKIVKCSYYNSWKDIKSDTHEYFPEIEPFLWSTKGWYPVDKFKIKQLCVKLNYNYANSKNYKQI